MKNYGAGRGIRIIFCLISCMNIFYLGKTFGKAMYDFILFYLLLFFFGVGAIAAYNSFLSPTTANESYHDVKCYLNRLFEILTMKSKLL